MPRKSKPAAPGAVQDIEAMIRVDHAGEYGAVRIYEGQLAVLKRRKGSGPSVDVPGGPAKLLNRRRVQVWQRFTLLFPQLRMRQRLARNHLLAHGSVVDEDGFHHRDLL